MKLQRVLAAATLFCIQVGHPSQAAANTEYDLFSGWENSFNCAISAIHPDEDIEPELMSVLQTLAEVQDKDTRAFFQTAVLDVLNNGIQLGDISLTENARAVAIQYCEEALAERQSVQNKYRLGRALISGTPSSAEVERAEQLAIAADAGGYAIANLTLGYIEEYHLSNVIKAERFYRKAHLQGVLSATESLGGILLTSEEFSDRREEGFRLLQGIKTQRPRAAVTLATFLFGEPDNGHNWNTAEAMLIEAAAAQDEDAQNRLARLYADKRFRFHDDEKAVRFANLGLEGRLAAQSYEVLFDVYYNVDNPSSLATARQMAIAGANEGSQHLNHAAGFTFYYAQGGAKDLVESRKFLQVAVAGGTTQAQELLNTVNSEIGQLEAQSSRALRDCLHQQVSSYDRNVLVYRNRCDRPINVRVCKQKTAGIIIDLLGGSEPSWQCSSKTVSAGQYIDELYDAGKNSSLLRKAITDAFIRLYLCYPPAKPIPQGSNGDYICKI